MTVGELINILQQMDPNKTILIRDTAAGNRDIKEFDDYMGYYTIYTEKPRK